MTTKMTMPGRRNRNAGQNELGGDSARETEEIVTLTIEIPPPIVLLISQERVYIKGSQEIPYSIRSANVREDATI